MNTESWKRVNKSIDVIIKRMNFKKIAFLNEILHQKLIIVDENSEDILEACNAQR